MVRDDTSSDRGTPASPPTRAGAPVRLFNSWSRTLEPFEPGTPPVARMYSCGLTVYARGHLGNLRAYVFADTLRRLLLWKGYEVDHVINVTDVGHLLADADVGEDKVEAAAEQERRSVFELTEHYQRLFEDDLRKLAVLPPRTWTKASDYVPRMIEFARRLEQLGHTYVLPSGLYFDTSTIDDYGVLATIDHDGLQAGARVEVVEGKRNATDFALWRTFPADTPPRAMEWESPWGRGAPGWHLECSVMSIEQLGPHFDIHTGGVDHREIHHPNEDAQSRAYLADGRRWVRYWLHNEFIQFGGEKMSKSKGNVLTLDDVVAAGIHPLAYRLLLLQSHYRSQVTVTLDDIESAATFLGRLVTSVANRMDDVRLPEQRATLAESIDRPYVAEIDEALSDDLSTPRAVAVLSGAVRDPSLGGENLGALLAVARDLLGLDLLALADERADAGAGDIDEGVRDAIAALVAERNEARRRRDFATADAIRERLLSELGVQVMDGDGATTWSFVGRSGAEGSVGSRG